jgi:hypothetical protein
MVFFRKILPFINFSIATSALAFQTMVLYPWHEQLEEDFKALEKLQQGTLSEFHQMKLKRMDDIDQKVTELLELEKKKLKEV